MLLFLLLAQCAFGNNEPKEPYWTKEQRYAKLMKITAGGKKVADIEMKDIQQLILDGMQDQQKTDWLTVVMFNGLQPQFNCHLCHRAENWFKFIAANTKSDGEKRVFYLHIDYSERTKHAFQALQFNMVPGWFIFSESGGVPQVDEAITSQKFNERFPTYNAQAPTTDYEESQMVKLMVEWFREQAKPYGKDIKVDTLAFKTPIRQDKVFFFGGLALVAFVLVVFYHKYLFTRYSIGILVMLFFSLSKSGLSRAIIKNDVTGNFDMAFGGKPTKWDCFITVGVEMMFALSLVGLNSSGPKLIKNPLCLLAAGAAYCGYFVIYKQHKPQYEYSPYHNYLEQYML